MSGDEVREVGDANVALEASGLVHEIGSHEAMEGARWIDVDDAERLDEAGNVGALPYTLGGEVDYRMTEDGVVCEFRLPVSKVME